MIKRLLCLLLALFMMLAVCACSNKHNEENVRGTVSGSNQTNDNAENTNDFSIGETAGNKYQNDFIGISCTLPEEWDFYSDEEIRELNNFTEDYIDEEYLEQIKNAQVIYDMFAQNTNDYSSININLEKLTNAQLSTLNIKSVLEAQIPTIESGYANMGYTNIDAEYHKCRVDGKEFDGVRITAEIDGVDFYGQVITFRRGNYLANITICSIDNDSIEEIFEFFTID